MSMKIGIFENESQVITAIQALEQEGFVKTEIKVLAKDHEHSQRVESETDIHADALNELMDTREDNVNGSILGFGISPSAGIAGGMYMSGTLAGVATPYASGIPLFGTVIIDSHDQMDQALEDLGLDNEAAANCRKAIVDGGLIVVADTGTDNNSDDGGPNLTRSGTAEAAFRRSGANRIL